MVADFYLHLDLFHPTLAVNEWRLMFAMAGSSILLWALLYWRSNAFWTNFFAVLAAIVLCSVSSGTFLMAIMAFYLFLTVTIMIDYPELRHRRELLIYASLLVVLMPYISMLVIKVINFFGGGISSLGNMIDHGYASVIDQGNILIVVTGVLIGVGLAIVYRQSLVKYWIVSGVVVLFLVGGIFGISTATIAIPPLLVVLSSVLFSSRA